MVTLYRTGVKLISSVLKTNLYWKYLFIDVFNVIPEELINGSEKRSPGIVSAQVVLTLISYEPIADN